MKVGLIQIRCVVLSLLALSLPQLALANKVALVVGNAAYLEQPLRNPVKDAELMQKTLSELGFEVMVLKNADRRGMLEGLREFQSKAQAAEFAVFYFAGHGVQVGGGNNYLVPVSARIRSERDVQDEAVEANSVLTRLEEARVQVGVVILDACRDNPYRDKRSSGTRGLARMSASTGSIVAYATAPGDTADDGKGKNGVYTEQLSRYLTMPGLDLREVFDKTAQEVERITGGAQKPREDVGLRAKVYLAGKPIDARKTGGLEADQDAWELAKRRDTQLSYQAYLREFPTGQYASAAKSAVSGFGVQAPSEVPLSSNQLPSQSSQSRPAPSGYSTPEIFKDCDECPEMVVIPGGSFVMGSPDGESKRASNEGPQHRVNVKRFALGRYEVTQGQWRAVMGNNPSYFKDCGDYCPVERVSWDDAQQFIKKLSKKTGKSYRLPSESEWEYAARAGCIKSFNEGGECLDDIKNTEANFGGYTFTNYNMTNGYRSGPKRIGSFKASNWGLYDMHGNVREWVQDCFVQDYSKKQLIMDGGPHSMETSSCEKHVLRGGSFGTRLEFLRSANRDSFQRFDRERDFGFRIFRNFP